MSIAACATAGGIARIRRGSNGTGMMYSRPKRGARALIGGGDFVGHVLARELGQRLRRRRSSSPSLIVRGAHIERAAEDVGEAEDVVDLVGIVRAAGGDDRVVADRVRPPRA